MEDGIIAGDQPQGQEFGQVDAGWKLVCLQTHLADSIYLWACGEKADKDEHDPKLSDMLLGWLILLVQGCAYGVLIFLTISTAREDTGLTEDAGGGGRTEFVLVSVTGAIYLLMISTSQDLRAGFLLLVDGARVGDRAFGAALLIVYGVMIGSALTVLASTSNDSASVLLNAVAVVFIADLDEQALKFFSKIPQNWRLFWALEFIGISFVLAVIAVFSMGQHFDLVEFHNVNIRGYPTWVIWVLNPTVVTICSYILSAGLHKWLESCSVALETLDPLTFSSVVTRACSGALASLQHILESFRREPVFYGVLGVWLMNGVYTEIYHYLVLPEPTTRVRFYLCIGSGNSIRRCINETGSARPYIINAMLVAGVLMKTLERYCSRPTLISEVREPCRSSGVIGATSTPGSCVTESRLPSLLVGIGVGYWVDALLIVLASPWPGGARNDAPMTLSVVGYVCLPCFSLVSVFMVADTNVFGVKFAAFIKPSVDALLDRRKIAYWVMMAVFRDALLLWVLVTISVANFLSG